MNHYQSRMPRAACAIAAVAMSLATMAAFIGAPSVIEASDTPTVMAGATRATPVDITPAHIDVVGMREAVLTLADATSVIVAR